MVTPGNVQLTADRWTPFIQTLTFTGIDLTAAVMKAQVRLTADTPGDPLVDLATVLTANTEGLRLISAGTVDEVMTSIVYMRINEATMEALPAAPEAGEEVDLFWDMQITPSGGVKQVYLRGEFKIRAGVTQ